MENRYHHVQRARLIPLVLVGVAVLTSLAAGLTGYYALLLLALLFVAIAWIFSSLTVEIGDGELAWHFGPGLWRYRLALDRVESATPVRNAWWYGLGIKIIPHGWLFNVDGLEAVEVLDKAGRKRRIGTDEPEALATTIMAAKKYS